MTTWLIHYSQVRETPWALAPINQRSHLQYATEVIIDVPSRTHQDLGSQQKTWCFIRAEGHLVWSGKVARIVGDK